PDHQRRINRRPTGVRVVGCKLLVCPTENAVDLSNQMIWWHYLVEIKREKELALPTFLPPHHGPLPRITSHSRNHGSTIASTRVLQHIRGEERTLQIRPVMSAYDPKM